jgi:hypothetical protein
MRNTQTQWDNLVRQYSKIQAHKAAVANLLYVPETLVLPKLFTGVSQKEAAKVLKFLKTVR